MNSTTVHPASQLSAPAEPTVARRIRNDALLYTAAAIGGVLLFWPTLTKLFNHWMNEPDFSHGFVIVGVSGAILVANRRELGSMTGRRSLAGLAFLVASLLLYFLGYRTMTNVFERLGLWGALVGSVWFLFGTKFLFARPFPYFYLLFCIPPPFVVLSPLRLALKTFATQLSSDVLVLMGIPAIAEGNVLALSDCRLEVADACSGIRSLMAITATAVLMAYLFRAGILKGAILTVIAIPVTILVNVLRLVVVASALTEFQVDLTTGWPHELVGFAVFGVSLVFLYAGYRFLDWWFRWRPVTEADR